MSWLYTLTELFFICFLWGALPASAQTLESALMPGAVIEGHAEYEAACEKCHVRFDRSAQIGLCLACHKDVAADVRGKSGYHGRINERECRTCHTEHKGRAARIIKLEEKKFDHNQTDFVLRGKHRKQTCISCHLAKTKHRTAATDCSSCHRKDDRHKGGLGPKCENCHNEDNWKEARFDHQKTHFPLLQRHADVKCISCHVQEHYLNTPKDCASCHREDDAHKGFYGPRCDSCHNAADWKVPLFRHDRDTRYPLLDRHRQVKCLSCHLSSPYRERTPTRCNACHRSDDPHKGALGDKCDKCHNERGWKGNSRFSHDADTQFPLRDAHKAAKCESCHKDKGMQEKLPVRCFACHKENDQKKGHKGAFGEKCDACHNEKDFAKPIFDHDRDTKFRLSGKHYKAKCSVCHEMPLYGKKPAGECNACHKSDDIHFGSFGLKCEHCHTSSDWRKITERHLIPSESLKLLQGVEW